MGHQSRARLRAYLVTVEYFSDRDCYAIERFEIEATCPREAERLGLIRADDSVYDDPRIPDLTKVAHARRLSREAGS